MARNPELEAILEARYDWEGAAPSQKAKLRDVYYELLDQLLARQASHGRRLARGDIIEAMGDEYKEFRRARDRRLAARVRRLR
ncbi:MAG: hypothetical protein ABSC18_13730 [Verrucomicrobiota bacterium]|jgi:hypothetical protein